MSKLTRKCLHSIIIISGVILYIILAWLDLVPSLLHLTIIRRLWDKEFTHCWHHLNSEVSLPIERRHDVYITAQLSGRLGNWLFAYASLMGIADRNDVKFFISPKADPRVSLASVFKVGHVKLINTQCSQTILENKPCAYDKKMELLPYGNLTIKGYLQSWKYFTHIEKDLRKEFQFQDHLLQTATSIMRTYVKNSLRTCVHVRRTDMMIWSSAKIGFKAAPVEYLHNAMGHIRQKFSQPNVFVVISDDVPWCSKNLKFSDSIILPPQTAAIDLALLSLCNNTILSTGTFGWWGAWLANGYTVYYKNYPEPGTRLDRDTVKEDFFPPHWVAMNKATNQSFSLFDIFVFLLCPLIFH